MRLFELFDKKVDWEWKKLNGHMAEATFHIGSRRYDVVIEQDDPDYLLDALSNSDQPNAPKWLQQMADDYTQMLYNVVFTINAPSGVDPYAASGTGNEYLVFATVMDIMKEFAKEFPVDWWTFSSKEQEPSRKKLYDRMASRFSGEVFVLDNVMGDKIYVAKA
jgi:hypothetical protein